jgi:hypothetical protein
LIEKNSRLLKSNGKLADFAKLKKDTQLATNSKG